MTWVIVNRVQEKLEVSSCEVLCWRRHVVAEVPKHERNRHGSTFGVCDLGRCCYLIMINQHPIKHLKYMYLTPVQSYMKEKYGCPIVPKPFQFHFLLIHRHSQYSVLPNARRSENLPRKREELKII